jgi:hypothetical protein
MLEKLHTAHERCPALMPVGNARILGRARRGRICGRGKCRQAALQCDGCYARRHAFFLLADTAAGLAYLALLAEGESGTTVEMKINLLRPVWQTRLRAEARIIQQGATFSLAECDVLDSNQRLVAHATATMMRLTGRAAEGRTTVYGEHLDSGHDS